MTLASGSGGTRQQKPVRGRSKGEQRRETGRGSLSEAAWPAPPGAPGVMRGWGVDRGFTVAGLFEWEKSPTERLSAAENDPGKEADEAGERQEMTEHHLEVSAERGWRLRRRWRVGLKQPQRQKLKPGKGE